MSDPWSTSPESLLADHAWANRLARRLVRDAAQADDLAQEACTRALEHPPARDLRAWLGGVVRNLARSERRARGRRARREAAVAAPEAQPSAADTLERLAVQQAVVRAVLALPEPYRSTIVLRFYDGLPPRRIATRAGVPVATVKTRLARGLAQLRAALDREHGGAGREWALYLLPLTGRGGALTPWLAGAFAMQTTLKIALASAAALGLFAWFVSRGSEPRARTVDAQIETTAPELVTPRTASEAAPSSDPRREELSAAAPVAAGPVAVEEAPSVAVTGLVLDPTGAPVPGVELALRGSGGVRFSDGPIGGSILWREDFPIGKPPLAVSGPDGSFRIERTESYSGHVVSQDARWETVLAPYALPGPTDATLLVVAPRFRLRGRVTDPAGAPLAGVELRFAVPLERAMASGLDYSRSRAQGWSTTSDADGRFAFDRLPSVAHAFLHARREPFLPREIARDDWHDDELEIVLAEPDGAWLTGLVEARGAPLAGATVALGYRATKSDEHGGFRLSLAGLEKEDELCAAAHGLLPVRVHGDRNEDGTVRWPSFVRVTLEGAALELTGRVLDENDRPLADQTVSLVDATVAWVTEQGFPVLLESLLAGGEEMTHDAKTDEEGRFVIGGLEERDYRLQVVDPKTALVLDGGTHAAGARDVVIRRPPGLLWPRVRGTVVDRAGKPLAGVSIHIDRESISVGVPEHGYFGLQAYGSRTTTTDDGSFELLDVPRGEVVLHVYGGEDLSDPELELDAALDPENVRVTVARRAQLQVHAGTTQGDATAFAVLDTDGTYLDLRVPTGAGSTVSTAVNLTDGRSPVVGVSDAGVWLVLFAGKEELARIPLALAAEGVNRIDL